MTICSVKFSFWMLILFLLTIPEVLFQFVHETVVEILEKNNTQNGMLNDESDNSAYVTAEEKKLDGLVLTY